MPPGWRVDSLRCTSTGIQAHERSEGWRTLGHGPDGDIEEVDGLDPIAALQELIEQVARRGSVPRDR